MMQVLRKSPVARNILEYRTYKLSPSGAPQYFALADKYMPLRMKHSELVGMWRTEIGGLNEVHHVWKYDSYEHRAAVRAALAKDPEWIEGFVKPAFPHFVDQTNSAVYHPSWAPEFASVAGKEGGSYEIWDYNMVPGGPSAWGADLQRLVDAMREHFSLYGVLYTEVGNVDVARVIWRHDSFDKRREGRAAMREDPLVVKRSDNYTGNVVCVRCEVCESTFIPSCVS